MTNERNHTLRGLIQTPLAVFPLLALLLVLLSLIAHQQASAAGADLGYTGTPDVLVVASHDQSIRELSGKPKKSAATEGEKDLPDSRPDFPIALSADLPCKSCIVEVHGGQFPATRRFLIPRLRAPPLL